MMPALFLGTPTRDRFDAGAGSSYQARRQIRSFPTWLAQAAALVLCSELVDVVLYAMDFIRAAPPRQCDLAVLHTTTFSFSSVTRSAGTEDRQSRPFEFTISDVAEGRDASRIDGRLRIRHIPH
jgi:hypothetical protein